MPTTVTLDNTGKGTVTIPSGGFVTIKALPIGSVIEVTETNYSGYAPKWNLDGTESYTNGDKAQATVGTHERIYFTNVTGAVLPNTGGIGTGVFRIIGMTMMALAGAVIFRKRRNEA